MTNKERQNLEKEYPMINVKRMIIALSLCGIILIVAGGIL